jgi:citrate lyase subunit beta/citryl-CoA lyase
MPGSKERALEKARSDAVGLAEKEIARELVTGAVRQRPFGKREVIIRINGLDTQWGDADLEMAASAGPDAILVPKVENAAMVQAVAARLAALGAPEHTSIWAMMETPLAMLNAPEIAGSSARLSCLVMGTNDLVGLCMLAARACKLSILDGVYNAIKDEDGLRASCIQGREMGFDGKTLIHPAQIAVTGIPPGRGSRARGHRGRWAPGRESACGECQALAGPGRGNFRNAWPSLNRLPA